MADRDPVGVDAAPEHRDVLEVDARFGRLDLADREHGAIRGIRERAVPGGREQLAVRGPHLRRAEDVGGRDGRSGERDRDRGREGEGAHPPAR